MFNQYDCRSKIKHYQDSIEDLTKQYDRGLLGTGADGLQNYMYHLKRLRSLLNLWDRYLTALITIDEITNLINHS